MKNIIARLFVIFMSMCLIFTVFLSQSVPVHAEMKSYTWDELKEHSEYFIYWVYSQIGAVFKDHDFVKFLQNEDAFNSYFNEQYVSVNNGSITVDKEFMQWLKQYLINYSKQNQTYTYGWSTAFDDIPYTTFGSFKPCMDTVKNVLDTAPSGTINLATFNYTENGEFRSRIMISTYDNLRDIGFVGNADKDVYPYAFSTLKSLALDTYVVELSDGDSAISSWEEFKEKSFGCNMWHDGTSILSNGATRTNIYFCNETQTNRVNNNVGKNGRLAIVTRKRTTFRLFRSTDYLFDYSLGKRGIYFTSGFWDYEPDDITGTLEDINDSIDRLDDVLNSLLDRIDDKTQESEIEDLLRQILEELKNGGSGGNGENGGSSGGDSGNYDSILEAILDYLKMICSRINDLLEEIRNFDFSGHGGQDFNDVVESMDRLNESLQELYDRMDDDSSGEEIEELLQQILDELRNKEGQDFDGVVDSMESIDDKLQELLDLIGDDMSREDIGDILQQILDALNNDGVIDGMESIDDKLQELLDSINDNLSREDIEDILQQILDSLNNREGQDLDGVIDGMENIEDKLQELLDSINDNMSKEDIEDILQQILDEMRKQEGLDGVNERLDSLDETLNEILKELRNSSNYDGLFGDLISLLSKILDDPETGSQDMVDALSSSLGELASGLTEKFPFSIPWDIQAILLGLADTPKAPRFELPIVVERYGIDEKVVIDMEMFETLSDLSRSFFSVLFAMFLINLTFKVVGMKKED